MMKTSKISIGHKLKSDRVSLSLSIYRVAKDTGLQESQIKSMERASTNYTIDTLHTYQNYLNSKK